MLSFKCFVAPKKLIWYFSGTIVHGSARRKTRFPFVCAFALRNRGAHLIDAPSRESCSTRGLPLASTGSAEHSGPTRLPARKRRAAGWHSPKKGRQMIGGSKQKYEGNRGEPYFPTLFGEGEEFIKKDRKRDEVGI